MAPATASAVEEDPAKAVARLVRAFNHLDRLNLQRKHWAAVEHIRLSVLQCLANEMGLPCGPNGAFTIEFDPSGKRLAAAVCRPDGRWVDGLDAYVTMCLS